MEESEQIDIGVELGLFDDRLTVEADLYRKTTKDLLMTQQIPGYIGATNNPTSNLGEIRNQGIDLNLGYRAGEGNLKWNTQLTYTHFKNEVISVAGETGYLNGWGWPVRNTAITHDRRVRGRPLCGYQADGIFQNQGEIFSHVNADGDLLQPNAAPGDIRFLDTNGDGTINSDDIGDIGSPWPKHIIGLSANVTYKDFYASAIFNAQIGHEIYRTYERSDVTFSNYQSFCWAVDAGKPQHRFTAFDINGPQQPASFDFYLENGNFLRLRNLQIGWNVPANILEKFNMKEAKIYLTGTNLFTLTNYRGFDPDIGTSGWILIPV